MKIKRKIYAISLVIMIVLVSLGSMIAVDRTITDTSDTMDTYIKNSNGNYWEPTGANIQKAIYDIGNETKGAVYLPGGIIDNDQKIYFTSCTSIIGAGSGNTIINCTSATGGQVFFGDYNKHNFSLEGVTIECNNLTGNGVYCRTCTDIRFIDVTVLNATSNGFGLWIHCKRATVRDLKAHGCAKSGTVAYSYQGLAINNVSDSTFDGIDVTNTGSSTATSTYPVNFHGVRNCTINHVHIRDGGGMKVYGEGTWYVENSTFNNIVIKNVTLIQAANANSMWIHKCNGCTFNNIVLTNNQKGTGIKISETFDIILSNFIIDETADCGIDLDDAGVICSRIKISEGIIKDTTSRSIRLENTDNVTFSNVDVFDGASYSTMITSYDTIFNICRFMDTANIGMSVNDCHRFKFLGCDFIRNTYGIRTVNTCSNYSICNCYLDGNSQDFIDISAGDDYYMICNNIFVNKGIRAAIDDNAGGTNVTADNLGV